MTSPLRRKRQTTVPGRRGVARTWVSLLLGSLLFCSTVLGQTPYAVESPTPAGNWKPSAPMLYPGIPAQRPGAVRPMPAKAQLTSPVSKTMFQQPVDPDASGPGSQGYDIDLEPPGDEVLFTLDSEADFFERLRQDARRRNESLDFPEDVTLSDQPYYGRAWPPRKTLVEPSYVCHKRLYFEELNGERYGWELVGVFQPLLSTLIFYKDVITLPYHFGTDICRCYDCSAGKCLPGDTIPYMWYPPQVSGSGLLVEAATIAALVAIFP